jgi:spore coat polysaccharide biosynthesis protein SpsF
MKRVAIIQARTGSTRLPDKVFADIAGRPMLAHVVDRVRRATRIDEVMVATTVLRRDDPIEAWGRSRGVGVFRGSEHDVLSRYAGAARTVDADVVVRITADCPLVDPGVIDSVVDVLCEAGGAVDYASNVVDRTFPRGLDAEAMFRDVLDRVERIARSPEAREHVTWFILREQPSLFITRSVIDSHDNSDLRWTVDEDADLEMIRAVYRELDLAAAPRPYQDIVQWVRQHPAVTAINAGVRQNT